MVTLGSRPLKVRIETLEAELAAKRERSAGHRVDFERERDRADRMVTTHDRLVTELENLRTLLEAAQKPVHPVTPGRCENGGAGCARPGEGVAMVRRAWMKREQWLIWIVAGIVFTLVLVAIGYRLVGQTASFSGPVAMASHDRLEGSHDHD
jgi:hypothetical protein